jgi:hypothetical protein
LCIPHAWTDNTPVQIDSRLVPQPVTAVLNSCYSHTHTHTHLEWVGPAVVSGGKVICFALFSQFISTQLLQSTSDCKWWKYQTWRGVKHDMIILLKFIILHFWYICNASCPKMCFSISIHLSTCSNSRTTTQIFMKGYCKILLHTFQFLLKLDNIRDSSHEDLYAFLCTPQV